MPSFASSSPIAPKSVSAFRSFTFASIIRIRRSGRRSKRFFGEIWPIITASSAPSRRKHLISFESWPTRTHSQASASFSSFGRVSPWKATTTNFTPGDFRRAAAMKVSG